MMVLPVYITIEGVLVGLAPQFKVKWIRDAVAVVGFVSLLLAVRTFVLATYQHLQLNQSSVTGTTTGFVITSLLFFLTIEVYAFALLIPVGEDRKTKDSTLNAWIEPMDKKGTESQPPLSRSLLTMVIEAFGYLVLFGVFGVAVPITLLTNKVINFWETVSWFVIAIIVWEIFWLKWTKKRAQNIKNLPLARLEAWVFVLGFFFSIIGAGSALVNLSTFGAQTISNSTCIQPSNVNVTSLNCTKIQTLIQAPGGGAYAFYGPIGASMVLIGEIGLPVFLATALILYLWIQLMRTTRSREA